MAIHKCALFCNNTRLVHERTIRRIEKYIAITPTYTDFMDGNIWIYIRGIVYRTNKEKKLNVT